MRTFAFILALAVLGGCAGQSTAVQLAQTCSAWGSVLFTLGDLRHEKKLSAAQIAAVDDMRPIANASCAADVGSPQDALGALRGVLTRARAIQRTAEN